MHHRGSTGLQTAEVGIERLGCVLALTSKLKLAEI